MPLQLCVSMRRATHNCQFILSLLSILWFVVFFLLIFRLKYHASVMHFIKEKSKHTFHEMTTICFPATDSMNCFSQRVAIKSTLKCYDWWEACLLIIFTKLSLMEKRKTSNKKQTNYFESLRFDCNKLSNCNVCKISNQRWFNQNVTLDGTKGTLLIIFSRLSFGDKKNRMINVIHFIVRLWRKS